MSHKPRRLKDEERVPEPETRQNAPWIGECVDDRHASLRGRVRVRWVERNGSEHECWVATLQGLVVRRSDRVLLTQPDNWPEALVVGVVDGFARRPEAPEHEGPRLELARDEVMIVARDGAPLIEVRQSDDETPRVRILSEDLRLEVPGRLEIGAEGIAMRSKKGGIVIEAEDDLHLRGEVVKTNCED